MADNESKVVVCERCGYDKPTCMCIINSKYATLTGDEDFDSILAKCIETLETKGNDYTIGTGDRLHNFKTVAGFTGMTPEQVLGVYFYKHVSAVFSFIKKGGQNESEPIEGRIMDVVNYMLLFHKMVQERKRGKL